MNQTTSITDAGDQSCGQCWPDARDLIEPLTGLIGSVPSHDQAVELQDLGLQHPQLGAESGETPPRNLGYAFVTGIGDNIEQCLDPIASDRRDDAELGKMGTDRIDHCSLLADEQVACAMQHQAHSMTERLEFARPMMRGCAGLDTDKTWRQLLEESSDVTALQFAPDDHFPFGVDAVNLKNRFCDIETNCRDRLHGLAPPNQVTPLATTVRGTYVP